MPLREWETDCVHISSMDQGCARCADARIAELDAALKHVRNMIEATDPHNSDENMKLSSRVYRTVCDVLRNK